MLSAAQTDTLGLKVPRRSGICRSIGIRPHIDVAHRIRPAQKRLKGIVQRRLHHLGGACQYSPVRAVNGDYITRLKHSAIRGRQQI